MLGNPADAEDLLQEIFLSAHRKLDGFRGESALGTWLYRLATNQCLDYLRSRAARTNQLTDALDDEPGLYEAGSRGLAEQTVTKMDLERALAQLPEGCRAAFVLHDVEGLEHREVAEVLGIAEGTSKSQVHKARLRLRFGVADGMTGRTRDVSGRRCIRHIANRSRSSIDGTLGRDPPRGARAHLDECADCRALLADLEAIRDAAGSLDRSRRPTASGCRSPDGCGRKGACTLPPARQPRSARHVALLAIAAALVLAVGASLVMLLPQYPSPNAGADAGGGDAAGASRATRRPTSPSKASRAEFRLAEQHYQNAIAKLEQAARLDRPRGPGSATRSIPQTAAMLQKNLQVIDQAIAESRARCGRSRRARRRATACSTRSGGRSRCCRTRSR